MGVIAADRCVPVRDVSEPRLATGADRLGYAVAEGGEGRLVVHHFDGRPDAVLATAPALRPGRSLGGGAWCWSTAGDAVVYVGADGNLWHQRTDGSTATQVTRVGPDRQASAPHPTPDGRHVVYVLDQAEVRCAPLSGGPSRRLDNGRADFCMDPFVAPDGTVLWQAWNVPDMPWDHARVERAQLDGRHLRPRMSRGAVQQPRLLPDGRPICVRDDRGWLNVYVADLPVVEEPVEHAGPTWGAGQRSYAWSPDGTTLAFTRNERGFGRLCVVPVNGGTVREVARGVHGQLSWEGNRLAAMRTGGRTPTQVVHYDTATWDRTVVPTGPDAAWSDDEMVEPELVRIRTGDGDELFARFYRADGADGRLIVWLHGGPTDQWQVTFMPRLLFWRSRGWSVLVPDHRGSTGHGRAYQQALRGRWGELDVADTVAATHDAQARGWGTPERTVVMGSSAGGFTALGALASQPDRFAAAVVLYPVTDLLDLAERSHRFERHYSESLVGSLPASSGLYRERSPIWHADRYTVRPILLLHGDLDPVVPVEQSRVFAERVRTSGGRVELFVYAGEGHGFRQRANQLDEYLRIEAFLARHVPVGSTA